MKTLIAAAALLAAGTTFASAQYYGERRMHEREDGRYWQHERCEERSREIRHMEREMREHRVSHEARERLESLIREQREHCR